MGLFWEVSSIESTTWIAMSSVILVCNIPRQQILNAMTKTCRRKHKTLHSASIWSLSRNVRISKKSNEHQNHGSVPSGFVNRISKSNSTGYITLELSHGTLLRLIKIADDLPINSETLRPHELACSACFYVVSFPRLTEVSANRLLGTRLQLNFEMRLLLTTKHNCM